MPVLVKSDSAPMPKNVTDAKRTSPPPSVHASSCTSRTSSTLFKRKKSKSNSKWYSRNPRIPMELFESCSSGDDFHVVTPKRVKKAVPDGYYRTRKPKVKVKDESSTKKWSPNETIDKNLTPPSDIKDNICLQQYLSFECLEMSLHAMRNDLSNAIDAIGDIKRNLVLGQSQDGSLGSEKIRATETFSEVSSNARSCVGTVVEGSSESIGRNDVALHFTF